MIKPTVFIGSSSERLRIARSIQHHLSGSTLARVWTDGVFVLGDTPLEGLFRALDTCQFAVFVVAADDLVTSRAVARPAPRDNILFEIGLFMGRLGRRRIFVVYDRTDAPRLPSDLMAMTVAPFDGSNEDAITAVASACFEIEEAIRFYAPQDLLAGHSLRSLLTNHTVSLEIVNKLSHECVDVHRSMVANGSKVQQWPRHHRLNQLWRIIPVDDHSYTVRSKHSGKCLSVLDGSCDEGAAIVLWDDINAPYQRWLFTLLADGSYQIAAQHSGFCLSLDSSSERHVWLVQSACLNAHNQRWWLNIAIGLE